MTTIARSVVYPARTFNATEKKVLALKALQKQTTVTHLANENKVSCKFRFCQKSLPK